MPSSIPTGGNPTRNYKKKKGGRKKKSTVMRKTSRKGAYKKNKVRAFKRRMAPLVETKTRELAEIAAPFGASSGQIADPSVYNPLMASTAQPAPHTNAIPSTGIYNLLTLANFYTQFQVGQRVGVDNANRINGNNIFAKWLNVKGIVRFPLSENISAYPQSLELIWGYCPPINATTNTAPAVTGLSPSSIYSHITAQVSEYMNAQGDQLRFHPKRDQHCKIIGRRKVRPNLQRQYALPPTVKDRDSDDGQETVGVVPDWKFNISFKLMRKIHYDRGGTISYIDDNQNTIDEVCYNLNDHAIPFVCFYQPDYGVIGGGAPNEDEVPNVAYNSMFYFTDS
tara:strand:- start:651 stop:1664 length:1014 start_codon:yes stop_codon:yes gene_type:complete